MPIIKALMRVHLIRNYSYFCDMYFKITEIMSDNVIPGHFGFPRTSETYLNK